MRSRGRRGPWPPPSLLRRRRAPACAACPPTFPTRARLAPRPAQFANEGFELRAFGRAIDAFQGQEYLQLACISLLNIAQSVLVFLGLAMGEGPGAVGSAIAQPHHATCAAVQEQRGLRWLARCRAVVSRCWQVREGTAHRQQAAGVQAALPRRVLLLSGCRRHMHGRLTAMCPLLSPAPMPCRLGGVRAWHCQRRADRRRCRCKLLGLPSKGGPAHEEEECGCNWACRMVA